MRKYIIDWLYNALDNIHKMAAPYGRTFGDGMLGCTIVRYRSTYTHITHITVFAVISTPALICASCRKLSFFPEHASL